MGTRIGQRVAALTAVCRDSRGVTGLETAILIIAFTVVSAVFVFGVLNLAVFSSSQAKETSGAGLASPAGTLELKNFVIAKGSTTGDTGKVSEIIFYVTNSPTGRPVSLRRDETIIKYTDSRQTRIFSSAGSYVFTVTPVGRADTDQFVEEGEVYEIALKNLASTGDLSLSTRTIFTMEVVRPEGAVLLIRRTTPVFMNAFNDLG